MSPASVHLVDFRVARQAGHCSVTAAVPFAISPSVLFTGVSTMVDSQSHATLMSSSLDVRFVKRLPNHRGHTATMRNSRGSPVGLLDDP